MGALRRLQLALADLHRRVARRRRQLRHPRQGHEWLGSQRSRRPRRDRSSDRLCVSDVRQLGTGRQRHRDVRERLEGQRRDMGSPVQLATFQNPVCLFPPFCFNISGGQFRAPGSYPVPAFDPTTKRLYVAYSDIVGGLAQILLTYANVADVTKWTTPVIVAPASGDRINVELSVEPSSGRIDMMTNDRSYTGNTLFDVSYITSSDGGNTWTTRRVTKTSWDPSQFGVPCGSCASGVRPFIGDYDGIVSLGGSAAMTWTGPGKTFGLFPTNLEVFFASVAP